MHLIAAPDSYKSTLTAREAAAAIARGGAEAGWSCDEAPLSDGGEGFVDILTVEHETTTVRGPLGDAVRAEWGWLPEDAAPRTAVIEVASAAGLGLAGGPEHNDPLAATTYGVGELIAAAAASGADRIIVGCGGSATTDGGMGALEALAGCDLHDVQLDVAVDTTTAFVDAATRFGPQKGAGPGQVEELRERLRSVGHRLRVDFGMDVTTLLGAGAAGGLAGGLAALGGRIIPGFQLVAEQIDLAVRVAAGALVVTGEGRLDATSFTGKAVGQVLALAAPVPVLVVAGDLDPAVRGRAELEREGVDVVSLTERFGSEQAHRATGPSITAVVREHLGVGRR
jgi:glycerate 2-kinase